MMNYASSLNGCCPTDPQPLHHPASVSVYSDVLAPIYFFVAFYFLKITKHEIINMRHASLLILSSRA